MFLKTLKLQNFRSFEQSSIQLQPDLTVFVGENNGGKSNAIDAMRLLTAPLGGRREIYCETTDVRFQGTSSLFEIVGEFEELTAGQQGRMISVATDATLNKAAFGLTFDKDQTYPKPSLWGGKPGNSPEPGCHDTIRHVYLPPLRDAKRSLASGNSTRIMALLKHFLEGSSPEALAKELARTPRHDVLTKVDSAVEKGLQALTSGVRRQSASIGFASDESLIDIARDLRFRLADHGVDPEDLRYSGHGYANLLFMATIAVELEKVRTADLTLFLVEEPEAHLHPQLQAAVLSFLRDQAALSRKSPPTDGSFAGEIQIVVATHSPNLSAWVSSERLVLFKSSPTVTASDHEPQLDAAIIEGSAGSAPADESSDASETVVEATITAAAVRRSSRVIPMCELPLNSVDRRKVDRYLDVTKAALLFGGRVLLVEGIAEALLLPAMARMHTLNGHEEKLRLFMSAVFVAIDGVDFEPYVKLLLTTLNDARIAERVVVLTDGDKGLAPDEEDDDGDEDEDTSVERASLEPELIPGERRQKSFTEIADKLGAKPFFDAINSTYSLETELIEAGNIDILRTVYLELHPKSAKKWDKATALSGDERARAIHKIFKSTRKGDFAQLLAKEIEDGKPFKVPAYIKKAIEAVVA